MNGNYERYHVNVFVDGNARVMSMSERLYKVMKGMSVQVNEHIADCRLTNLDFLISKEVKQNGATIFIIIWRINQIPIKELGFDDEYDLMRLVNSMDLTSNEVINKFTNWQYHDGTKDGLIKLRFDIALGVPIK